MDIHGRLAKGLLTKKETKMKNASTIGALLVVAATFTIAWAAVALEFEAGPLKIDQPWARPTIGSATNTAAYMKLSNAGDGADTLLAAKTNVAEKVSLHESRMDGDVMRMVPLPEGIEIPAHGSAELKPLGMHVMLMGLRQPLKNGEAIPMTLVFERQGEVAIDVEVGVPKSQAKASEQDKHKHH